MLSFLVSALVFFIAAGVICWAARRLLAAWSVPNPWATTVYVIIVLICLVVFLNEMGWVGGAHAWRSPGLWR